METFLAFHNEAAKPTQSCQLLSPAEKRFIPIYKNESHPRNPSLLGHILPLTNLDSK